MDNLDLFSFKELDVYTFRKDILNECVKYFIESNKEHEMAIETIAKERGISKDILREVDMFYVDEDIIYANIPEEYKKDRVGICYNRNVTMRGRIVFPIKDCNKDVIGFIGWDKYVTPKYIDSKTYGYEAKKYTLFGMENISNYYKSKKHIFITEGLFCSLWLRSKGFNSLSLLGTYISDYVKTILLRFGNRLVFLCDNDNYDRHITKDDAKSESFIKKYKMRFPKAMFLQCRYAKDINDTVLLGKEHEDNLISDLNNISFYSYKELQIRR